MKILGFRSGKMWKKVVASIFYLLVIFIVVALVQNKPSTNETTSSPATQVQQPEQVISVSAGDLCKAYEENEVKADNTYKDKKVEVTGKIRSINVVAGKTYIVLESGKEFSLTDVQAYFSNEADVKKIADLSKENTITFSGNVKGKSLNVEVENCALK